MSHTLIRLHTDSTNGIFKTVFNDDIIVKPYSKIALKNCNFTLDIKDYIVNAYNPSYFMFAYDETFYNTFGSGSPTYTIPNGTYTKDNIDSFLHNMEQGLNAQIDALLSYSINLNSNKCPSLGYQWKCSIVDNKVVMSMYRSPYAKFIKIATTRNKIDVGTTIERNAGTPGDLDSYMSTSQYICKGYGVLRAKVHTLANAAGSNNDKGFILGLMETHVQEPAASLAEIKFGVHVQDGNTTVKKIIDGTRTATTYNPVVGDHVELAIFGGKAHIVIYKNAGGYESIELGDIDYNNKYYPILLMVGSPADCKVSLTRYTMDPYLSNVSDFNDTTTSDINNPTQPVTVPHDAVIQFGDEYLKTYLGFTDDMYKTNADGETTPIFDDSEGIEIVADTNFGLSKDNTGYVIVLDNINLNSYDSTTKNRQNILDSVTFTNNINNTINYQPSEYLYIAMNNKNPISLRNINARILNKDYESIITTDKSEITLIIKE